MSYTWSKMCIGFHVKHPLFLSDFNVIWIFPTDFRKMFLYQISWKSSQWEPSCFMRTDGRTDTHTDRHDEPSCRLSQFCEGVWNESNEYQSSISLNILLHFFLFCHISTLFLSLRTVYGCCLMDGARSISGTRQESPELPWPPEPSHLHNPSLNTTAVPFHPRVTFVSSLHRLVYNFTSSISFWLSSLLASLCLCFTRNWDEDRTDTWQRRWTDYPIFWLVTYNCLVTAPLV